MRMYEKMLGLIKMRNRHWKNKTLKKIIEILEVKIWILEAMQKMACQDIFFK